MTKIIKLTESDLEQIIKRVLREDAAPLPDMENVPLGKVEAIQQALVDAGYDIGPTGVDGVFGRNTRNAVIKYQKANGVKQTGNVGPVTAGKLGVEALTSGKPSNKKPTTTPVTTKKPTTTPPVTTKKPTTTPVTTKKPTTTTKTPIKYSDFKNLKYQDNLPKSDYLGKGGEFERGLYGGKSREEYFKMKEFITKFPPAKKSSLPLHVRALMDYLAGRETPFTAADLTREEQNFLKNVATPNAKKGLTYPLWKEIGAGNLPTSMTVSGSQKEKEKLKSKGGEGSLVKPELAGQFMYTLGEISPPNIKVDPNKKTVTVYDRYDFNTKGKTKEDLLKSFTDQVGSWWKGDSTFYSVVRNAVAFKESGGYKGFPVNITV
jgi:peptidoglycan hydrolase-like protein with peptidoglycan-binding domain